MMREAHIEQTTCKDARLAGWYVIKLYPVNNIGLPDRLFLRRGVLFFCEFKAPGEQPRKVQQFIIDLLRRNHFKVFVVDSLEAGQEMLQEMETWGACQQ